MQKKPRNGVCPGLVRSALAGATAVVLAACGQNAPPPTVAPTQPPATQPTPAPTPTPAGLPAGMSCDPTPPPLYRMNATIFSTSGGRTVLDSKPLVVNVDHYCDRVGFGDWKFCNTRQEGDPQRVACDYLATGVSPDTGRWGPTWYYGAEVCSLSTQCANHPTNQFMAIAKNSGTFSACAADSVPVASNGSRCGSVDVN